ncbi:hypothetical protein CA54_32080 [Symmachiella macrocystis]|uniref:Uncharacterized protein n=1 Tax=Symmachiella macrocystis TaxID=2527985 RepID=A0A5C6BQ81_9PLAN|nr:hypothetical protein CA54_32080 [Symmachiella macrocystis]
MFAQVARLGTGGQAAKGTLIQRADYAGGARGLPPNG